MSNPGPSHGRSQYAIEKWQQLIQALRSPPSAEQQRQVLDILKSNPHLMAAFIKQRSRQQQQQRLLNEYAWYPQQQTLFAGQQQQPDMFPHPEPPVCPQCQHMPIPTNFGDQQGFEGQESSDEPVGPGHKCVERVAEDMGKLFVSGDKSDVTVKVREAEFRVHSLILCARSPVLSAMLEQDTAERASHRIHIDDCEPDVFGEYLRYIYTGSVQFPSRQTAFGLYRVADKYLADDLKLLCSEHIQNSLCVQTFCDTVRLALVHEENELYQRAIHFAGHNFPSIVISAEWQDFICEDPMEANEILTKCFGRQG